MVKKYSSYFSIKYPPVKLCQECSLTHLHSFNEEKLVVLALTLCDAVLVANLVVVVIISGYENFVSRIDVDKASGQPLWIKRLSPDAVKMKIAGSIIAISSISLLKQFLEISKVTDRELLWGAIIHGVFVISALLVALISYIEKAAHKKKTGASLTDAVYQRNNDQTAKK